MPMEVRKDAEIYGRVRSVIYARLLRTWFAKVFSTKLLDRTSESEADSVVSFAYFSEMIMCCR